MDPTAIRAIADAGAVTGLILILIGGYRGWWRYGPQVDQMVADLKADRDFWRQQALRGTGLAEKAVDVATGRAGD